MSIGYNSKAVIYSQSGGDLATPKQWHGVELSNVRVELEQKLNASTGGTTSASTCTIKIYDTDLPEGVMPLPTWADAVFVITGKEDINRSVSVPTGDITDKAYAGGFLSYLQAEFGMVYKVVSLEHYSLIPHWAVNGE